MTFLKSELMLSFLGLAPPFLKVVSLAPPFLKVEKKLKYFFFSILIVQSSPKESV